VARRGGFTKSGDFTGAFANYRSAALFRRAKNVYWSTPRQAAGPYFANGLKTPMPKFVCIIHQCYGETRVSVV